MKKSVFALAGVCLLTVGVAAWQSVLPQLRLGPAEIKSHVERATRDYPDVLYVPGLYGPGRQAALALSPEQRVAAVNEIAAAVKALVSSPEFVAAHAAFIKERYKAADHGLKPKSAEQKQAELMRGDSKAIKEMQLQAVVMAVQVFGQLPIDQIKPMFESDLAEWTKSATRATAASNRAKAQKMVAKAKEIQPLAASDPEKFKRGYMVLKSMDMDGPEDEATLFALANASQHEAKQLEYDKRNLKAVLRTHLRRFIAEASTVDYAAETVQKGRSLVFVNPAYERKNNVWKAVFRAGRAPGTAALEAAKAWLKELS